MSTKGWLARLLIGVVAQVAIVGLAQGAETPNTLPIFNSVEKMAASWKIDKGPAFEFQTMLGRWKDGKTCETAVCTSRSWPSLVAKAKAAAGDPLNEIKLVNDLMNDKLLHRYIEDGPNWGEGDYWATPYQFLKKSGDCEDYAIAKYMLLKAAGMPVDRMRVFTVTLRNLHNTGHAILIVYLGNTAWVLDNLSTKPVEAKYLALEYKAVISVNEDAFWVHMQK